MYVAGIDIGSTASKAVLLGEDGTVAAKAIVPIGTGTKGPARVFSEVMEAAGIGREEIGWITATGYSLTAADVAAGTKQGSKRRADTYDAMKETTRIMEKVIAK